MTMMTDDGGTDVDNDRISDPWGGPATNWRLVWL